MTDDAYNTEGSSSAEDDSDDAYARQDGADSRSDQQWLMSLEVGSNVDAKDRDKWYAANVVGTSDKLVKVHYIGFGQRYDRWLERDTKFIRRRSRHHSIAKDSWGRPIFVAPSSSESTRSHRSTTPGTDQLSRTAELSQRVSKYDSMSIPETRQSKEEAPDDFGCPFHGCNKTSRTAQFAAQHMVTHMSYEEAPRAPPRKRAKRKK